MFTFLLTKLPLLTNIFCSPTFLCSPVLSDVYISALKHPFSGIKCQKNVDKVRHRKQRRKVSISVHVEKNTQPEKKTFIGYNHNTSDVH
jgi:hypothetical protein